jgi:two-component system chemotaxis response regulator CheY
MKLRALVIDDSRVMRTIIKQSLHHTGLAEFEFTEAEDGADALARFRPNHVDILFVDWNMPKVNGIDFVRQVRSSADAGHIPVVMITSERTMGRVEEALDSAGADAYITKPFTVEELRRSLSKLIEAIAARRQAQQNAKPSGLLSRLVAGG